MTRRGRAPVVAMTLSAVIALTSCAASQEAGSTQSDRQSPSPSDESSAVTDEPGENVAEAEPLSQQEQWVANFESNRSMFVRALRRSTGTRIDAEQAARAALVTCTLTDADKGLDRRINRVWDVIGSAGPAPAGASIMALGAAVTSVCPELESIHTTQVTEYQRQQKRARKAAAQKRREQAAAARRAAREEAAQQARDEAAQSTFYENCTAVEAAGAAPIYAGEPGYSSDLDRDGDGVACEQ